jgi:nicotinamide mononucleotide adenylyltransferase
MTQQLPPVAGSQTVDGLTNGDTSKALQAQILPDYSFPDRKLKKTLDDSSKTPLVLIACGSFSPITYLHLRMFEMVADHAKFNTEFEVVGGYLSPVSDAYKKKGLATAEHRYVAPNIPRHVY